MAKKTFAELIESVKAYTGERNDDETLALMEDINDTLNSETDWQAKYTENDNNWRKKYKERFEGGKEMPDEHKEEEQEQKPVTFNDLFK